MFYQTNIDRVRDRRLRALIGFDGNKSNEIDGVGGGRGPFFLFFRVRTTKHRHRSRETRESRICGFGNLRF